MTGTFGLKSTTWTAVRAALRKLGGKVKRQTGKHNSTLMIMPGGTMIAVGKDKDVRDTILAPALVQLFDEVRRARLEPMLFLAVLDTVGPASWHRRPATAVNMAVWLKSVEAARLHTAEGWRTVLKEYAEHSYKSVPKRERVLLDRPGTGTDQTLYPYDSTYVANLTGLQGDELAKASLKISYWMNRGALGKSLLDRQLAVRVQTGKVKKNYFSEEGALAMAQEALMFVRPDLAEDKPVVDRVQDGKNDEVPVEKKEVATGDQYGTLEALTVSKLSAGQCLLELCSKFGVSAKWSPDDPFKLNVERTIQALHAKIGSD